MSEEKVVFPKISGPHAEFWNSVCDTDIKFTKEVSQRGGYTAINPEYQIACATQKWGPYGKLWGLMNITYERIGEKPETKEPVAIAMHATFFYPIPTGEAPDEARFQISVDAVWKAGDDTFKKLRTQAQSKALSLLGFNADVFMNTFSEAIPTKQQERGARGAATPQQEKKAAGRWMNAALKKGLDYGLTEEDFVAYAKAASNGTIQSAADITEKGWYTLDQTVSKVVDFKDAQGQG